MKPSSRAKKQIYKATESQLQEVILIWLQAHRILAYRSPTQGQLMNVGGRSFMKKAPQRGVPDITGVLPGGTALYIEVKRPDWKPPSDRALTDALRNLITKGAKDPYETYRAQREFQCKAAKAGAIVIVATSLVQVENIITQYIAQEISGDVKHADEVNEVYMPFMP